ncbi:hypothetical protein [Streptomyces sp. NPDC013489]|uniref:hypothetical protein n=1 Tax=Streptomyces sp. NPDC013489 TaxID=3155606 RepID=UPI0033D898B0
MNAFPTDPNELDETLEVGLGRRAPFSQLGDWVLFSGVDSDARTLYWGLSAHINTSERGDTEVWPGLASLARILQLKKPENVAKFMLQLEVIGAIEVVRTMVGLVRRNRYIVHQTPPASHVGAKSTSEWYALNRGPKGESTAARKEREAEFDQWLTAARAALKAHCEKVAKDRAAAKKAKAPFPAVELFVAPCLEDFRTPSPGGTARPAAIQKPAGQSVPPRQGVRTPWRGGPVPPGEGVERDQPQLDQSLSPSSPATAAPAEGAEAKDEREIDAARKTTTAASAAQGAPVPEPRTEQQPNVQTVADAYTQALAPVRPMKSVLERLRDEAAELLALDWPVEHVAKLAGQLPGLGYSSLARHAEFNPPPVAKATRPSTPKCERHPSFEAVDCLRCAAEERERRQRGNSEPAPVDGAGLLARLTAGQTA